MDLKKQKNWKRNRCEPTQIYRIRMKSQSFHSQGITKQKRTIKTKQQQQKKIERELQSDETRIPISYFVFFYSIHF